MIRYAVSHAYIILLCFIAELTGKFTFFIGVAITVDKLNYIFKNIKI